MANTRQKLAGGAVIGVAALAFYLGMQWQGIGPGGTGSGFGTPVSGPGEENAAPAGPDLAGDEAVSVSTQGVTGAPARQLITIVIAKQDYLLTTPDDLTTGTAANLSEVAHAAQETTGDSEGIRARVYHRKDATAGAMADLKRKLDQVGIPPEAIQYMSTPIPIPTVNQDTDPAK